MYRQFLNQHHGIARASALIERGLSRYRLAQEVAAGTLKRIARGWIALPSADPQLVHAAQHGLTVSCISQAARLGLWVKELPAQHFAVQRHGAEKRPPHSRLHYALPLLQRAPYSLQDSIENTLVLVAGCVPFEDAVAIWDSALNKKLVDHSRLEMLPLPRSARSVLESTLPFADSGLESYLRVRLRWLREPIRLQIWISGHRVDALIGERLIMQIDGGHHVGAQRTSDIRHDAELTLMGYTVHRVGYDQMMNNWPEVQELIMHSVALGLHRDPHPR